MWVWVWQFAWFTSLLYNLWAWETIGTCFAFMRLSFFTWRMGKMILWSSLCICWGTFCWKVQETPVQTGLPSHEIYYFTEVEGRKVVCSSWSMINGSVVPVRTVFFPISHLDHLITAMWLHELHMSNPGILMWCERKDCILSYTYILFRNKEIITKSHSLDFLSLSSR